MTVDVLRADGDDGECHEDTSSSPSSSSLSSSYDPSDSHVHTDPISGNGVNASATADTTVRLPKRMPTIHVTDRNRDESHYISTLAAGVGSGALASIICAPLDLMRTRMQVWGDLNGRREDGHTNSKSGGTNTSTNTSTNTNNHTSTAIRRTTVSSPPIRPREAFQELLQREGWRGMFRGLGVTLVTVPLFWGVYFPLYDETKYYVNTHYNRHGEYHDSFVHMGSAVFTGAVADIICNPLFVVRTRLQTQALHQIMERGATTATASATATTSTSTSTTLGIIQTARALYDRHGITIFWRGMSANLIGLSHVAVQFPAYEYMKKFFRDKHKDGSPETAPELLLASGVAKMGASLLSYPHEVLRSRMMDNRSTIPPTLIGTAKHILRNEGAAGLYTGLSVTLIRVVPNCCMTFLSYEMIFRHCRDFLSTSSSSSRR